ncbi:hypothetical protein ACLM5H_05160 [Fredinandcohnia humi]
MVPISSLISRAGAKQLREEIREQKANSRGDDLSKAILSHFDAIHSKDTPLDFEIEKLLIRDELKALENDKSNLHFDNNLITFSPSSASKCERELFYKAVNEVKDEQPFFPYQRRWTRNGTAVHSATQRDLLYAEKYLESPAFKVVRMEDGTPAWEKNIRNVKQFEHNGISFQIYGMMDGLLKFVDYSTIGFEFKTKSTTIGAVGSYKMKDAQDSHKQQCIAYSLLFGINEFLIVYESLAKDGWTKGAEAKPDMRAFYVKVTEEDKQQLLDKFARVAGMYYAQVRPQPDTSKCLFCPYKTTCNEHFRAEQGTA